MNGTWIHRTVLLNEAIAALLVNPDGHYVDATFGRGGHSRLLLSQLSPQGRLTAFDKDLDAIAEAQTISDPRFSIRHEGFMHLGQLPAASAAGVLMDLGVSSPQIDNPVRGFSFRRPARHAHGHHARRKRGRLAGDGRNSADCRGDS